jgi:hypothetical protein
MKIYRVLSMIFATALVLAACNLPNAQPTEQVNPNAVFTAAAETVVAQLTQSALLNPTSPPPTVAPPTITLAAAVTNTPQLVLPPATSAPAVIPTTACDAAQFITDVSIPDGTVFAAGATFVKTWRLKNIGTCTWNSSYALVFDSGTAMGGAASVPLSGSVAPGGSIDVSVNLQAPSADGTYRGFWGVTNASGARVPVTGGASGRSFYVEIKVGTGTSSGTPVNAEGRFAVTSVGFNVDRSGACESMTYTITATVTTNKAGDVNYTWKRSDGATGASNSGTLTFDNAGSKTITFTWTFGGGSQWVDLYIDKPNHQQFGRATLNCP